MEVIARLAADESLGDRVSRRIASWSRGRLPLRGPRAVTAAREAMHKPLVDGPIVRAPTTPRLRVTLRS
jgi:hypothetical protein